jgi:VWFA-related protein
MFGSSRSWSPDMLRSVAVRLCLILLVAVWPTPTRAQAPAPQEPVVSYPTGTSLVTLDFVVRDKRGRPVKDLRPEELEVLEDAQRCELKSFRLVDSGRATEALGPGPQTVPAPPVAAAGDGEYLNLVTLVFDRLDAEGSRRAQKGALDFIEGLTPRERVAVWRIGARLELVVPFTGDKAVLTDAIDAAARPGTEPRSLLREALQAWNNYLRAVFPDLAGPNVQVPGAAEERADARPGGAPDSAQTKQLEIIANTLRWADSQQRQDEATRSLYGLLALLKAQQAVAGRKTVILFSPGFSVVPAVEEALRAAIGQANHASVTFYAVDTRGLRQRGDTTDAASMLQSSVTAARSQSTAAVTRDQVFALDTAEESLRLNPQGNLRELAESTSGFLVANTNDLAAGLGRIRDDIGAYYQVTFASPRPELDGSFRKIALNVSRRDITVQGRSGYQALPPLAAPPAYETMLAKALEAEPAAGGAAPLPFRAAVLHFGPETDGRRHVLIVEVPLANAQLSASATGGTLRARIGMLAVVKDEAGRVVGRFVEERPVDTTADKRTATQGETAIFRPSLTLRPGLYRVAIAAGDTQAGRVSARRYAFEVPEATDGPVISSVSLVRRSEPVPDKAATAPSDPLRVGDLRIVPELDPRFPATGPPPRVFATLYPGSGPKPRLEVEFVSAGRVVAHSEPSLPDEPGPLPFVGVVPVAALAPGRYELRLRVTQGEKTAEERAPFEIVGPSTAVAPKAPARSADPALAELLEKAGAYVAAYERTFSDLLAEERYTQQLLFSADGRVQETRVMRSELVFVRLPGDIPWTTFRDVFESDGRAVRDRESRLEKLFVSRNGNAVKQAEAILRESARFNLGRTWRNFNVPVAALPFLHPQNQDRFTFERKGQRTIEGLRAVQVHFEEARRPTLIRDTGSGGNMPARGEFWIDPANGRVLRSEMTLALNEAAEVSLLVDFRPEPKLDIWVPSEMREFWGLSHEAEEARRTGHSLGSAEYIECVARYTSYRRFVVKTQEDIHVNADPDARPPRP